jgi:hypothetical protein
MAKTTNTMMTTHTFERQRIGTKIIQPKTNKAPVAKSIEPSFNQEPDL